MSTAKKTTKKPARRPEPFQHAADLADAYRELKAAIEAVIDLREHGPLPLDRFHVSILSGLSMTVLWQNADENVAAWERIGAAARRAQVAIHGKKDAARWVGFVRRKAA